MVVFWNKRRKPVELAKTEALYRRLHKSHPSWGDVKEARRLRRAGYNGEKEVDYQLALLPEEKYQIINGLRLEVDGQIVQIDTLLLTGSSALIIESKNIHGTVVFDDCGQMIRTADGNEEGMLNPILQAQRQKILLRKFFQQHNIRLPIDYVVVFSRPTTVVKLMANDEEIRKKVIKAQEIYNKVNEVSQTYTRKMLTHAELVNLIKILLASHQPKEIDILKQFNVDKSELILGIQCPGCGEYAMGSRYGRWHCGLCQKVSVDAHKQMFEDYFLLIGPCINNKQCRDFVGGISRHKAKRLLQSSDLDEFGTGRGIYYCQKNRDKE